MSVTPGMEFLDTLFSITNAFVSTVAPILLIMLAVREIDKWRKELVGKRKIELACKIVMLALRFEEQYLDAVSPVTSSNEWSERIKKDSETPDQTSRYNEGFARANRLNPLRETRNQLKEAIWEAEFYFGKDLQQSWEPFREAYRELSHSISVYFFQDSLHQAGERHTAFLEKLFNSVYDTDDTLKSKVNEATLKIKNQMQIYMLH